MPSGFTPFIFTHTFAALAAPGLGAGAVEGIPVLSALVSPDRWLFWLGLLFVLSVYYFPAGVVGKMGNGK